MSERLLSSSEFSLDRSRRRRGDGQACALMTDLIADVDVENAIDDEWKDERVRTPYHA